MIYVDKDCNLVKTTPQAEQERTHAEHLRLAAGLPEVQALIEAHRRLCDICYCLTARQVVHMGDDAIAASGLNPWCLNEGLAAGNERINLGWANDALAPFEEAT